MCSTQAKLLCDSDYDKVLHLVHSMLKDIFTTLYMKTILRNYVKLCEIPSMMGIWIFSGTTHFTFLR